MIKWNDFRANIMPFFYHDKSFASVQKVVQVSCIEAYTSIHVH